MEEGFGNAEARKHIKQLENQIIKFKHIIQTALELSDLENSGLQNEKESIREAIEKLEEEKSKLENELNTIEENNGSDGMLEVVNTLESENVKLKAKFEEVLSEVKKENQKINVLKKENYELNQILENLENEKARLMERLRMIRENANNLTCENVSFQERLPTGENQSNVEDDFEAYSISIL